MSTDLHLDNPLERVREAQHAAWSAGQRPLVEEFLQRHPEIAGQKDGLLDLIYAEVCFREARGEAVTEVEYATRFPQLADNIRRIFAVHKALGSAWEAAAAIEQASGDPQVHVSDVVLDTSTPMAELNGSADPPPTIALAKPARRAGQITVRCPSCRVAMPVPVDTLFTELKCDSCDTRFSLVNNNDDSQSAPYIATMGRFDLNSRLGVGAFGSVWKAYDRELDRTVAIKLPRNIGMTAEDRNQFLREARAAAQLRHPNIVSVHEVGSDGESAFIVSDFVKGVTLGDWLYGQMPTAREAATICLVIAKALHHAHEQGVIHRDLKPANIMIDGEGQPHILDFGLAHREVGEVTVTLEGHILGTPAYMSPEQAAGKSHHADRRSDVYSLGVILFQLLTGELPFRGNMRMLMHQVINDDPPSPRKLNANIPKDLEVITLKCLEKDPAQRLQSAQEFADELHRFLNGQPILSRAITRAERSWRWCKRHPTTSLLTATVIAITIVGMTIVTWQWLTIRRAEHNRSVTQTNQLLNASPEKVPLILNDLESSTADISARLREMLSRKNISEQDQARIRLGLLREDRKQVEHLSHRLFTTSDSREFVLLRDSLAAKHGAAIEYFWDTFADEKIAPDRRFRAAMILAAEDSTDYDRWKKESYFVAEQLLPRLLANPSDYPVLVDALKPMRAQMIEPLTQAFCMLDRQEREYDILAHLLAEYACDQWEQLLTPLLNARPAQFTFVFAPIAKLPDREDIVAALRSVVDGPHPPVRNVFERDLLAKNRANATIALTRLQAADRLPLLLGEQTDPSARSYLIHRFGETLTDPGPVLDLLVESDSNAVRRGALLILGKYTPAYVETLRPDTSEKVVKLFNDDPDPGIHSAARWVLLKWQMRDEITEVETASAEAATAFGGNSKRWFINSNGDTMLVNEPDEFMMGSPELPNAHKQFDRRHLRRIHRTFAVAACETTNGQFRRFRADHRGDEDRPAESVSWMEAVAYCNWLSAQQEIPANQWCYVRGDDEKLPWKPAVNFLSRAGYRLPTEAEWEYVCRAKSTTPYFFGQSPELLSRYAWCPQNTPQGIKQPVGQLMPNDAGVFDIYGNACEWCHDYGVAYPRDGKLHLDLGGPPTSSDRLRVLRGFAAGDVKYGNSSLRDGGFEDKQGVPADGFRVAKTIRTETESKP